MTTTPDDRPAASSRARPLEIEEPLNRLVIHPLSRRLVTLLIPTGISPNAVSALGVFAAAAAAAAYALLAWPVDILGVILNFAAFAGFILHLAWHVLDGADGDLARRTGRSSPSGEVIDGICDYLAHIVVYVVLALLLVPVLGGWAWLLASGAGLSRAIQANHYESARRTYQWWVYDVRWIRQTMADGSNGERERGFKAALARGYLAVSGLVSAEDESMERMRVALMASPKAADARALYAASYRPRVKFASWLGALHETQAIFVSMLAGSAAIFFVYELVVLNAVMLWSITAHRRTDKALKPKLAALLAG
jgi:phosphatidylglycerophosphate synthase